MRIGTLLLLFIFLAGCTSYQKISSGAIGCAPSQITVYDVDSASEGTSWTAVCQNSIYYCFQADSGMGGKIQCSPAQYNSASQPAVAVNPPARQAPEPQYQKKDDHPDFFSMLFGFLILDRILRIFN